MSSLPQRPLGRLSGTLFEAPDRARYAPALETLSIDLAMARDPVEADVAHAHTWYADMAGPLLLLRPRLPPPGGPPHPQPPGPR